MADTVTLIVDYNDGVSKPDQYTVDFEAGMNVEEAMKRAYDASHVSSHPFSFVLSWFGNDLGYFIDALNGIAGNRVSGWFIFIGDAQSPAGIDEEILTPNETVTFRYLLDRDMNGRVKELKARHYGGRLQQS